MPAERRPRRCSPRIERLGFDAGPRAGRAVARGPGRHNVLNARAALAALELAGFDLDAAAAALADFPASAAGSS